MLLALGLLAAPGTAAAASLDELLAGAPATGTLADDPADITTAQTPKGTLSDTPTTAKSKSLSSESEVGS